MIPTKASDAELERYVANILAAYRASTLAQRQRGASWYQSANDLAFILGDGDVRMGAGIIAALSQNKGWTQNVRLATDAAAGNIHGHVAAVLAKVAAIMSGDDPADVLPMHAKTGHFYRCIIDPSDPDPVAVDRHAHDIAAGEVYGERNRGLSNANRYATLAHAYREAARRLGIVTSVLQATVWVMWRDALVASGQRTRGEIGDTE